ncbi:MAG: T9SS type A sorting domain-containing protein [Bacteroidetes bacterium]|nr:T9SS type A sorting domain-containing protein [Bacteroidota bacterium]
MMKKIFALFFALLPFAWVSGQNIGGLVTTSSDMIGYSNYPDAPLLIQSGPEEFYWMSTSGAGTLVDHPELSDLIDVYANLYFIKYDDEGTSLGSGYIQSTSSLWASAAFAYNGGLIVLGNSSGDVTANGNTLTLKSASQMEFLAHYNDLNQFQKIVPVWDLDPFLYPYSKSIMDEESGDIFLVGKASVPFKLNNQEIIGKEWDNYLYVLRYDRNLELTGVFTAGFEEIVENYVDYHYDFALVPTGKGGVIVSGTWEGNLSPIIGGDTLTNTLGDTYGVFAFQLNSGFTMERVWEGVLNGFVSEGPAGISEGYILGNGDIVMVGETPTGYFSLDNVVIDIPSGNGFYNQFAFRMTPEGSAVWINIFETMEDTYMGKGTDSDKFSQYIRSDAMKWKEEVLYLTGKFKNDALVINGKPLQKTYPEGSFVAAIDIQTGVDLWGYSLSSDIIDLYGFDQDVSGNLSLLGRTGALQDFEGIGETFGDGSSLVFHLGLDWDGNPLWHNNANLEGASGAFYGSDLEVLDNGAVFSSMYKTVSDALSVGGASLSSQYDYSTYLVGLRADNMLGGNVYDNSGAPVYPGWVKAYKSTRSGKFPVLDSVQIDDSGAYAFSRIYPGEYKLKAIPDLKVYPDAIPTYGGGAISWDKAKRSGILTNTRYSDENITLSEVPKLTPEDGSGVMSGNVSYEDDVTTKSTMARPSKKTAVILIKKASSKGTQEEGLTAYVDTDELGDYVFENIPDGEYLLIVDIPGLTMIQTYDVEIVGFKIVSGLDFLVGNEGINTSGTVGIGPVEMEQLVIFPNPGNGVLHMMIRDKGDYYIQVFNTAGKMVDQRNYSSVSGMVDLDLSEMERGMYLIMIEGEMGSRTVKYVKE